MTAATIPAIRLVNTNSSTARMPSHRGATVQIIATGATAAVPVADLNSKFDLRAACRGLAPWRPARGFAG